MSERLGQMAQFIPTNSAPIVNAMLDGFHVQLVVTKNRLTKHGDYRRPFGSRSFHKITVNGSLNKYAFLLTLVHEIAHMHAFSYFGDKIAPHGREWKKVFATLVEPFFREGIWPQELVGPLFNYFKNPKASSSASPEVMKALSLYDDSNDLIYLDQLEDGSYFFLKSRPERIFKKINSRRTRVLCLEVTTKKQYAIHKMADVVEVYEE